MIKITLTTLIAIIFLISANAQNNANCIDMAPFCLGTTYTSAIGGTSEPGNDYDCLSSTPNPSWYFLKTSIAGQIDLLLSAPSDIDFIIYGPFTDYADISNNCGTLGQINSQIEDCSYSVTNMETPSITSTTPGEYYLLLVTNYANSVQDITLVQTGGNGLLDCSVFNEPAFQAMTGNIFFDVNQNGINDVDDIPIPNFSYQVSPTNFTGYSNYNGLINYNTQTTDTVDYIVSSTQTDWTPTTTNPYLFTLDTTNNIMDTLFFGFYPNSIIQDVDFDIVNNITQCVANSVIWININNIGTDTVNGNYIFNIPNELQFVSSTQNYDSIINNTIHFSFDSLYLFEAITFPIQLQPISGGIINIGDTMIYSAQLDLYSLENTFIFNYNDTIESPVICSYDPNIKLSFPNGGIQNESIEPTDSLEYVIHFQNTGNAAANNITITDTLSTKLDLSSFKFLSSSHQNTISIDSNRILTFQFDNIMLPDSNTNEPLSHGFIKFRMNLENNLVINDSILNSANIYFDFNAPIITATTLNVIQCASFPNTPNFTTNLNTLYSNLNDVNYTYNWQLNNEVLLNEVSDSLEFTENGLYTLEITDQYNCKTSSEIILCPISSVDLNFTQNSIITADLQSGTDYTWLYNSDTLTDTTNTIQATTNGLYEFTVNNEGCILTADLLICSFVEPTLLEINDNILESWLTPSLYGFVWIFEGDTLIGETNNNLTIASNGTYQLIATNLFGCYDKHFVRKICSFIDIPSFTVSDGIINSNLNPLEYTFIWLLDGDTLSNETNSTIIPIEDGLFTLISTDSFGCHLMSDYNVALSIIENRTLLKIYPNPSNGQITISNLSFEIESLTIIDETGRIIKTFPKNALNNDKLLIKENEISSGVYYLKIKKSNGEVITKKIIKL